MFAPLSVFILTGLPLFHFFAKELFPVSISNQQCEECHPYQKFQGVDSGSRKGKLFQKHDW